MAAMAAEAAYVMSAMQTEKAAKMEALAEVSCLRDKTTAAQVSPVTRQSFMHEDASSELVEV